MNLYCIYVRKMDISVRSREVESDHYLPSAEIILMSVAYGRGATPVEYITQQITPT